MGINCAPTKPTGANKRLQIDYNRLGRSPAVKAEFKQMLSSGTFNFI